MKTSILTIVAIIFTLTTIAYADDNNRISVSNNASVTGGDASVKEVLQSIKITSNKLAECTKFCFENFKLRNKLVTQNVIAFDLTNDKQYLEKAVFHARMAERNYAKGEDISQHMPEALHDMNQTYLQWHYCIEKLEGSLAAIEFTRSKDLGHLF